MYHQLIKQNFVKSLAGICLICNILFVKTIYFPTTAFAQAQQIGGLLIVCLAATPVPASAECSDHCVNLHGGGFQLNKPVDIWRTVDGNWQLLLTGVETNNGTINIGPIRSATTTAMDHVFYGVQELEAVSPEAKLEALKLAQFTPRGGDITNCITIHWDPYGAVFDAISLEPIPKVSVSLYQQIGNNHQLVPVGPGVKTNPTIVAEDGIFNFMIDNGIYFLEANKAGYTFPVQDITALQERLAEKQNIYFDLYQGEPIIQAGQIQHRDIPLIPNNPNNPTINPPKITKIQVIRDQINNIQYHKAFGMVSHPKSIINVYSGGKKIAETIAGSVQKPEWKRPDYNYFEILIENSLIDQNNPLQFEAVKNPAIYPETKTQTLNLIKHVFALTSQNVSKRVFIDPIPSRLEGFVYDKTLSTIPLAKVQIFIPEMNNRIVSTVKADKNGFIKLAGVNIPPVAFKITLSNSAGRPIQSITPATFISQNQDYLKQNKINLLIKTTTLEESSKFTISTDSNSSESSLNTQKKETQNKKLVKNVTNSNNNHLTNNTSTTTTTGPSTQPPLPFLFLFLFLGFTTALVFVFLQLRKKNQTPWNI